MIVDEDGRIQGFQEKPDPAEALSDLGNCGIYVFEPEIFDYFPDRPFVDWAQDVFPALLEQDVPLLRPRDRRVLERRRLDGGVPPGQLRRARRARSRLHDAGSTPTARTVPDDRRGRGSGVHRRGLRDRGRRAAHRSGRDRRRLPRSARASALRDIDRVAAAPRSTPARVLIGAVAGDRPAGREARGRVRANLSRPPATDLPSRGPVAKSVQTVRFGGLTTATRSPAIRPSPGALAERVACADLRLHGSRPRTSDRVERDGDRQCWTLRSRRPAPDSMAARHTRLTRATNQRVEATFASRGARDLDSLPRTCQTDLVRTAAPRAEPLAALLGRLGSLEHPREEDREHDHEHDRLLDHHHDPADVQVLERRQAPGARHLS